MTRAEIFAAIVAERQRQQDKHGHNSIEYLLPARQLSVLVEEVGEIARAMNDDAPVERLRDELIQVAAVAVGWLESLS